jgi:hypothetical protein
MSAWQPMESAPKDGTPVLVFDPPHKDCRECGYQVLAYSPRDDEWFLCDNDDRAEWQVRDGAHWQPLPEPPTDGE